MLEKELAHQHWRDQLFACDDIYAVGCALVACAHAMLPRWKSFCDSHDRYDKTISAMDAWVSQPRADQANEVTDRLRGIANVKTLPASAYLSMPRTGDWPPWPEPTVKKTPGEYAGDSIVAAANYISEIGAPTKPDRSARRDDDSWECMLTCIDSALQSISRAMGERMDEETETDIWAIASDRLRDSLIIELAKLPTRTT